MTFALRTFLCAMLISGIADFSWRLAAGDLWSSEAGLPWTGVIIAWLIGVLFGHLNRARIDPFVDALLTWWLR